MIQTRIKVNRTGKYLAPVQGLFGKTFLSQLNLLTNYTPSKIGASIIEYSIADVLYSRAKRLTSFKENLFITFDTNGVLSEKGYVDKKLGKRRFLDFLSYIRKTSFYVDDYWDKDNRHVVVLKVLLKSAFYSFIRGEYSKMYSHSELKELKFQPTLTIGGKKYPSAEWVVLTKNPEYGLTVLHRKLEESFGVDETGFPDNPREYDIPWFIEDEIRNYQYLTDTERYQIQKHKSVLQSTNQH